MVKEAILSIVKVMVQDGIAIDDIKDAGYMVYAADPEYRGFDNWVMVEIDRSEFEGKPQRINVSLPDTLIKRIDNAVKGSSEYKDRSHFIAEAARHKLKQ